MSTDHVHDQDLSPDRFHDSGLAGDRTALAWTRSAISTAGTGALIARAAFEAHVDVVGAVVATVLAVASLAVWYHGQRTYLQRRDRFAAPSHQPRALLMLTWLTVGTAGVATFVALNG